MSTAPATVTTLLSKLRKSPTPGRTRSSSSLLCSHELDTEIESESSFSSAAQLCLLGQNLFEAVSRCKGGFVEQDHLLKRCQYLEAEVEYLRDHELELRERACQQQTENSKLVDEVKALTESYRDALTAKRKAQEAYADQKQSLMKLHAAYNKRALELAEVKVTPFLLSQNSKGVRK